MPEFPHPPVDDRFLYDLDFGRLARPVIAFCQEVELYEMVGAQPLDIAAVARNFSVEPRAAEAVLVMSTALGLLTVDDDGLYELSETGRTYLLPTSPFYRHIKPHDLLMADLLKASFSGSEPIDPHAVNIQDHSDGEIADFIRRMHSLTLPAAGGLGRMDIFAGIHAMLDVGGGSGSLSCGIASQHPHLRSTILDIEPVCCIALDNAHRYGLEDRISAIAADMFSDTWPLDQDAVLFGNIFHDWDIDACAVLAENAFTALKPGGKIMLHEILLSDSKSGPAIAACMSVAMLLHEKGKQYTFSEFEGMLTAAGFGGCRSVTAYGHYQLVIATKPVIQEVT